MNPTGKIYGYHRVSTKKQHLDRGVQEIETFCLEHQYPLERIYVDKVSGKTFDRPRWTVLVEDVLRAGDTLIFSETDRIGRNKEEIVKQLRLLKEKGVRVMILEIPTTLIDVSSMTDDMAKWLLTIISDMMISIYAAQAEHEVIQKRKRQREGFERLRQSGQWDTIGRPRKISDEHFIECYQEITAGKQRPVDIMRREAISASTFYRIRDRLIKEGKIPQNQTQAD